MKNKAVIMMGGLSSRMKDSVERAKAKLKSNSFDKKSRKLLSEAIAYAQNGQKAMTKFGGEPFLNYLLYNLKKSEYGEVLLIVGENNTFLRKQYGVDDKNNEFHGLKIHYATQRVFSPRIKPFGTADALFQGLMQIPEWKGEYITVIGSDNLFSPEVLSKLSSCNDKGGAIIDFDSNTLGFAENRIGSFSVIIQNEQGYLIDVEEKPSPDKVNLAKDGNGRVSVNMNAFRLKYEHILPYLASVRLDKERNEKNLPWAVADMSKSLADAEELETYMSLIGRKNSVRDLDRRIKVIKVSEQVPDLTSLDDFLPVNSYIEEKFSGGINWAQEELCSISN